MRRWPAQLELRSARNERLRVYGLTAETASLKRAEARLGGVRGPFEDPAANSNMDRLAEGGKRRFEGGLGQSRVGMHGMDDLLERGLERPSHGELVNQLGSLGAHDVDAQDLSRPLVGHDLEEAFRLS